jgi:hypothetical protein
MLSLLSGGSVLLYLMVGPLLRFIFNFFEQ